MKKEGTLLFLASTTLILNVIDALCTMLWVSILGVGREANPVMAFFLNRSPTLFLVVKLLLVEVSVYVLWRSRSHALARYGLLLVFLVYSFIVFFIHSPMLVRVLG